MPVYRYQARDERGTRVSGVLEASSEGSVDEALRTRGLYVTAVEQQTGTAGARAMPELRISRANLILFTVHLATILSSGIPLTQGLAAFADEAPNRRLKAVARSLLESIQGGASLSEAMARLPGVFPEMYVSLVRAGETVGRVDAVLLDLVSALEWQQTLISQIRQAAIYPMMLLGALAVMMAIIVTVVMPRFIAALLKAGATIPRSTRIIMAVGEFITDYWLWVLSGCLAGVIAILLIGDTRRGRYALDWLKLRAPIVGSLVRKLGLSRFAHHLALLHSAGVDFVLALTVVERLVGNAVLARAVAAARQKVIAGSSLTDALRASGQFPPLVLQMVATGESSGNLSETLGKVSQYYDREVPATVKRVTAVIEPLVYILLGTVVLGAALSFYSPLLSMLQKLRVTPRF
jgi:type IV pilus assembly protein PilC